MEIKDVQTAPERRTFANAVAAILVLAIVSLLLEIRSGSDLGTIIYSFGNFIFILIIASVRFRARSSERDSREKLWIVALWNWLTGLVARLLPGGADPSGGAPAAPGSAAASTTIPPARPAHDGGGGASHD